MCNTTICRVHEREDIALHRPLTVCSDLPNHYQHNSLSTRRVCLSCCNHNSNNLVHAVLLRIESFATCIYAPLTIISLSALHSWSSICSVIASHRSLAPENYYQRASPSDKETILVENKCQWNTFEIEDHLLVITEIMPIRKRSREIMPISNKEEIQRNWEGRKKDNFSAK